MVQFVGFNYVWLNSLNHLACHLTHWSRCQKKYYAFIVWALSYQRIQIVSSATEIIIVCVCDSVDGCQKDLIQMWIVRRRRKKNVNIRWTISVTCCFLKRTVLDLTFRLESRKKLCPNESISLTASVAYYKNIIERVIEVIWEEWWKKKKRNIILT